MINVKLHVFSINLSKSQKYLQSLVKRFKRSLTFPGSASLSLPSFLAWNMHRHHCFMTDHYSFSTNFIHINVYIVRYTRTECVPFQCWWNNISRTQWNATCFSTELKQQQQQHQPNKIAIATSTSTVIQTVCSLLDWQSQKKGKEFHFDWTKQKLKHTSTHGINKNINGKEMVCV